MPSDYQTPRAALRSSHEKLAGLVNGVSASQLTAPSYCSEWNNAQLLSHIGSGGEIGLMLFEHAVSGSEFPGQKSFEAVWDKWNARSPEEVAGAVLAADLALLQAFESADPKVLDSLDVAMFGRNLDADGLISMRLGEHVLHVWDLEVTTNPDATLQAAGVEAMIDRALAHTGRFARGEHPSFSGQIAVRTESPERSFVLDVSGENVTLEPSTAETAGEIDLPAEALIRLLYGRLDEAHTPASVKVSGPVSLDELRVLFPGF